MSRQIVCAMLFALAISTACVRNADAKSAAEAWSNLVPSQLRKHPAFVFVKQDATLPNVLIYGDSISMAYTPVVRKNLAGQANVYRLHCNGGESASFIPKMKALHQTMRDEQLDEGWAFDWDVIHFNVGLHDVKYLRDGKLDKVAGKQVCSLDNYAKNLEQIVAYLKQHAPNAQLIFATTTPVPAGANGRIVGDAEKYNAVALQVLKQNPEILINDLYGLSKPQQEQWWSKPGDVHYNAKGRQAQGEAVAQKIAKTLSIELQPMQ